MDKKSNVIAMPPQTLIEDIFRVRELKSCLDGKQDESIKRKTAVLMLSYHHYGLDKTINYLNRSPSLSLTLFEEALIRLGFSSLQYSEELYPDYKASL